MSVITVPRSRKGDLVSLHEEFAQYANASEYRDIAINTVLHSDDALAELRTLLVGEKDTKESVSILDAILRTRGGEDKPVASISVLPGMVSAWIDRVATNGWVIQKRAGMRDIIWLVKSCKTNEHRDDTPSVGVILVASAPGVRADKRSGEKERISTSSFTIRSEDLLVPSGKEGKRRRATVAEIFSNNGFFLPTDEDIAQYEADIAAFEEMLVTGFAKQYRHTGVAISEKGWGESIRNVGEKVIHDVSPTEVSASNAVQIVWGTDRSDEPVSRPVPVIPTLSVFLLAKQVYAKVDARDLTEYVYDKSLREKLILPPSHARLLDVLTTDLSDFADDIVEGKSAGNVILTQGRPGVGKTLTAEVYSEIMERPLYSIHSGSLGTDAKAVRDSLEEIFARSDRWGVVLLLDEADVFVKERGDSIDQNAIVAEFLRTLEYFKGLLFMTTNRSDTIDDAILSRCAAIIAYSIPTPEDARRIWDVMVDNTDSSALVSEGLRDRMVQTYPSLAPRDIKMVLRLALRLASKTNTEVTFEILEECILFRGLSESAKVRV